LALIASFAERCIVWLLQNSVLTAVSGGNEENINKNKIEKGGGKECNAFLFGYKVEESRAVLY